MNDNYRAILKERTASAAIGASTIRRLAPKGTIGPVRKFLAKVDLAKLVAPDAASFSSELDAVTTALAKKTKIPWGASRKFLNIFLRDCLYNVWLREDFELARIEDWLEPPLDAHIAKGLKKDHKPQRLPRWPGVKHLDPAMSEQFQAVARQIAKRQGVAPVHLDIKYWRA
jgi:hypothetical protein